MHCFDFVDLHAWEEQVNSGLPVNSIHQPNAGCAGEASHNSGECCRQASFLLAPFHDCSFLV